MTWDAAASTIHRRAAAARARPADRPSDRGDLACMTGKCWPEARHVLIGASEADGRRVTFNGRIERPMLFDRASTRARLRGRLKGKCCRDWSRAGILRKRSPAPGSSTSARSSFTARCTTCRRGPSRGRRGPGREMCWRHAPDEYAAIHFHDDDIVDCRWPATHEWMVPSDFRSGSYALMLEAGRRQGEHPLLRRAARRQAASENRRADVDFHLRHLSEQRALRMADRSRLAAGLAGSHQGVERLSALSRRSSGVRLVDVQLPHGSHGYLLCVLAPPDAECAHRLHHLSARRPARVGSAPLSR